MTNAPTKKRKTSRARAKQRKKEMVIRIIFWICLLLLLVPCVLFGWMLLSSWLDTGSPILGNRYEGDLNPAITKSDLSEVESAVEKISGVEGVEVNLSTATLRVYADLKDSAGADTCKATAQEIYQKVTGILSVNKYFSQHDGMKMYDMEIHVYNVADGEKANFAYVIETKTSSMDAPVVQLVSEPIDAELAQQLRDSVENRGKAVDYEDNSNSIVVGGGEGEIVEDDDTGEEGSEE